MPVGPPWIFAPRGFRTSREIQRLECVPSAERTGHLAKLEVGALNFCLVAIARRTDYVGSQSLCSNLVADLLRHHTLIIPPK